MLAGPALTLRGAYLNDSAEALLWSWVLSAAVFLVTMLRLLQEVYAPEEAVARHSTWCEHFL